MILPNSITLRPGDSGDYVTELQRRLAQRDLLSEMDITGFYDATTTRAIKTFQSANGLKVDGIAGPETLRLLISIGGEESSDSGFFDENAEAQERTQGLDRYDEIVYLREVLDDDRDVEVAVQAHAQHVIAEHLVTESLAKDAIKAVDLTEESLRKNREAELQRGQEQEQAKKQERVANNTQLEITQQHMKAETLGEALKKDEKALEDEKQQTKSKDKDQGQELQRKAEQEALVKQETAKSQDTQRSQTQEQEQRQGQEQTRQRDAQQQQRDTDSREQTQRTQEQTQRAQAQNLTPSGRERIPLDPSILYFENHLSPASRMETHAEGEKLYARGVREAIMPPGMQLGDLVPSQTPNLSQRQQIGIGM